MSADLPSAGATLALQLMSSAFTKVVASIGQTLKNDGLDAPAILRRSAQPIVTELEDAIRELGQQGCFAEADELGLTKGMIDDVIDRAIKGLGAKPH